MAKTSRIPGGEHMQYTLAVGCTASRTDVEPPAAGFAVQGSRTSLSTKSQAMSNVARTPVKTQLKSPFYILECDASKEGSLISSGDLMLKVHGIGGRRSARPTSAKEASTTDVRSQSERFMAQTTSKRPVSAPLVTSTASKATTGRSLAVRAAAAFPGLIVESRVMASPAGPGPTSATAAFPAAAALGASVGGSGSGGGGSSGSGHRTLFTRGMGRAETPGSGLHGHQPTSASSGTGHGAKGRPLSPYLARRTASPHTSASVPGNSPRPKSGGMEWNPAAGLASEPSLTRLCEARNSSAHSSSSSSSSGNNTTVSGLRHALSGCAGSPLAESTAKGLVAAQQSSWPANHFAPTSFCFPEASGGMDSAARAFAVAAGMVMAGSKRACSAGLAAGPAPGSALPQMRQLLRSSSGSQLASRAAPVDAVTCPAARSIAWSAPELRRSTSLQSPPSSTSGERAAGGLVTAPELLQCTTDVTQVEGHAGEGSSCSKSAAEGLPGTAPATNMGRATVVPAPTHPRQWRQQQLQPAVPLPAACISDGNLVDQYYGRAASKLGISTVNACKAGMNAPLGSGSDVLVKSSDGERPCSSQHQAGGTRGDIETHQKVTSLSVLVSTTPVGRPAPQTAQLQSSAGAAAVQPSQPMSSTSLASRRVQVQQAPSNRGALEASLTSEPQAAGAEAAGWALPMQIAAAATTAIMVSGTLSVSPTAGAGWVTDSQRPAAACEGSAAVATAAAVTATGNTAGDAGAKLVLHSSACSRPGQLDLAGITQACNPTEVQGAQGLQCKLQLQQQSDLTHGCSVHVSTPSSCRSEDLPQTSESQERRSQAGSAEAEAVVLLSQPSTNVMHQVEMAANELARCCGIDDQWLSNLLGNAVHRSWSFV